MQFDGPVVLFDGVCNFCNGTVNFLIKQDKDEKLKFAALQSTAGGLLLQRCNAASPSLHSFVFIEHGKAYERSTAALRLLPYLPWYWQWARIFWMVPLFIRDAVYNRIAQNRYRWFGKTETCMLPNASVRSRFLT